MAGSADHDALGPQAGHSASPSAQRLLADRNHIAAGVPAAPAFSKIFTVTADNDLGPKLKPTMINELKRLIVLPVRSRCFCVPRKRRSV
jgi:hypothetical protein